MCHTSPGATPHGGAISRNRIDGSIGETRTSPRLWNLWRWWLRAGSTRCPSSHIVSIRVQIVAHLLKTFVDNLHWTTRQAYDIFSYLLTLDVFKAEDLLISCRWESRGRLQGPCDTTDAVSRVILAHNHLRSECFQVWPITYRGLLVYLYQL